MNYKNQQLLFDPLRNNFKVLSATQTYLLHIHPECETHLADKGDGRTHTRVTRYVYCVIHFPSRNLHTPVPHIFPRHMYGDVVLLAGSELSSPREAQGDTGSEHDESFMSRDAVNLGTSPLWRGTPGLHLAISHQKDSQKPPPVR